MESMGRTVPALRRPPFQTHPIADQVVADSAPTSLDDGKLSNKYIYKLLFYPILL